MNIVHCTCIVLSGENATMNGQHVLLIGDTFVGKRNGLGYIPVHAYRRVLAWDMYNGLARVSRLRE